MACPKQVNFKSESQLSMGSCWKIYRI